VLNARCTCPKCMKVIRTVSTPQPTGEEPGLNPGQYVFSVRLTKIFSNNEEQYS